MRATKLNAERVAEVVAILSLQIKVSPLPIGTSLHLENLQRTIRQVSLINNHKVKDTFGNLPFRPPPYW